MCSFFSLYGISSKSCRIGVGFDMFAFQAKKKENHKLVVNWLKSTLLSPIS